MNPYSKSTAISVRSIVHSPETVADRCTGHLLCPWQSEDRKMLFTVSSGLQDPLVVPLQNRLFEKCLGAVPLKSAVYFRLGIWLVSILMTNNKAQWIVNDVSMGG